MQVELTPRERDLLVTAIGKMKQPMPPLADEYLALARKLATVEEER